MTINDVLKNLNTTIDDVNNMLDIIERNSRENASQTLYLPKDIDEDDGEEYNVDFDELTPRELKAANEKIMAPLKRRLDTVSRQLKKTQNELRRSANKTAEEIRKLKETRDRLITEVDEANKEFTEQSNGGWINTYKSGERYSDESIKNRWKNASAKTRRGYKTEKRYIKHEKFKQGYKKRTSQRGESSEMIAESGLGNTGFGRFLQSAVGLAQSRDSAKNFNLTMQNGGAEDAAKAFLGSDSKAAQGAVKGLASGASKAGAAFQIMDFCISGLTSVLKFFGKIVADEIKYMSTEIDVENDILQADFAYKEATIEASAQKALSIINARGGLVQKEMDVLGENMLGALKIVASQYAKSHEIAANTMFNGITDTAYEAASAAYEAAAEIDKYRAQREQRAKTLAAQRIVSGKEMAAASKTERVAVEVAGEEYLSKHAQAKLKEIENRERNIIIKHTAETTAEQLKSVGSDTFNKAQNEYINRKNRDNTSRQRNGQSSRNYTPQIGGKYRKQTKEMNAWQAGMHRFGESYEDIVQLRQQQLIFTTTDNIRQTSLYAKTVQTNAQIGIQSAQIDQQITEKLAGYETQKAEVFIDAALRIKKTWLELAKNVEKYLNVHDKETTNTGISFGILNKATLQNFKEAMFGTIEHVASKFGVEIEEVAHLQDTYAQTTGRNKLFTNKDNGNLLGIGHILGDNSLAMQFAANTEIFNYNVTDSMELLAGSMDNLNKVGLNFRAYTEELVNDMKYAHKYAFKDGVKGLAKMVQWAYQTSFNMPELETIMEKIQTSNIQDVFEMSSQLDVLGGFASYYSDPLAMYHQAWTDTQGYAKRIQDMTKGFGRINLKTGETTFNISESMHITRIAKAIGRATETLFNEIRRRNRKNVIDNILKDSRYSKWTDEFKEQVANRAFYDRKKEDWFVKVRTRTKDENGDSMFKVQDKRVSDLNPESSEDFIMSDTIKGRILEHAQALVPIATQMSGAEIAIKANLSAATFESYLTNMEERTKNANDSYKDNRQKYVDNAKENIELITSSFKGFIDKWEQGNAAIDTEVTSLTTVANNINNNLQSLKKEAQSLYDRLKSKANSISFGPTSVSSDSEPTNNTTPPRYAAGEIISYDVYEDEEDIEEGLEDGEIPRLAVYRKLVELSGGDPYKIEDTGYVKWERTGRGVNQHAFTLTQAGADYFNANPVDDAFIPAQGKGMISLLDNVQSIGPGTFFENRFVQFANDDSFFAAQPGGEAHKLFKESYTKLQEIGDMMIPLSKPLKNIGKTTLNGNIVLNGEFNVENVRPPFDMAKYLNDNPIVMRNISSTIRDQMRRVRDSGSSKTEMTNRERFYA